MNEIKKRRVTMYYDNLRKACEERGLDPDVFLNIVCPPRVSKDLDNLYPLSHPEIDFVKNLQKAKTWEDAIQSSEKFDVKAKSATGLKQKLGVMLLRGIKHKQIKL